MIEVNSIEKAETRYQDVLLNALNYTARMMGIQDTGKAMVCLNHFHPTAHSYFRYAVAKETMDILRAVDPSIVAGYLVGESEERDTPHRDPLNVVIVVKRKTAALISLVADIAAGLLVEYKSLMGESAKDLQVFALFELADEQDSRIRHKLLFGYFSLMDPPIKLTNDAS